MSDVFHPRSRQVIEACIDVGVSIAGNPAEFYNMLVLGGFA